MIKLETPFKIINEPVKKKAIIKSNYVLNKNKDLFDHLFYEETIKKSTLNMVELEKSDNIIEDKMLKDKEDEVNDTFSVVTDQMTKFKQIMVFFLPYFKKNVRGVNTGLKRTFEYFKNVIVIPSLFSLYKLTYFANSIDANKKYIIYQIVHLFLENYNFFLNKIDEEFDLVDYENDSVLKKYMEIRDRGEKRNKIDINTFIKSTTQTLQKQIKLLNSEKFEHLNVNSVFGIYFSYIHHDFVFLKSVIQPEKEKKVVLESEEEKIEEEEEVQIEEDLDSPFYNNLKTVIENYDAIKNEFTEEHLLHGLFTSDDVLHDSLKSIIFQDILLKLDNQDELISDEDANLYNLFFDPNMIYCYESIDMLFRTNLFHCKNIIVQQQPKFIREQLLYMINTLIPVLTQFLSNNFNYLNTKPYEVNVYYDFFCNAVNFLKNLCKNNDRVIQTFLLNLTVSDEYKFISYVLNQINDIIDYLQYFKQKSKYVRYFKKISTNYFDMEIEKISSLLVDLYKGSFEINFMELIEDSTFDLFIDKNTILFDLIEKEPDYEYIVTRFMFFICSFLEENAFKKTHHEFIIKKLIPKKLIAVLFFSFNKLSFLMLKDEIIKEKRIEYNYKVHHYSMEVNCSDKLFSFYKKGQERILNNNLFIMSSYLFYYFEKVMLLNIDEKLNQIFENLKKGFRTRPY